MECFYGGVEALLNGAGGDDGKVYVAVGRTDTCKEVGLLRLGGEAGGGAAALYVDDDNGDFGHPTQPQALVHKAEAGACRGGHGLLSGKACSEEGGDGLNLGTYLVCKLVWPDKIALHPKQDWSGGRDWVADVEVDAGGHGANGDGVVSFDEELLPRRLFGLDNVPQVEAAIGCLIAAQGEGLDVGFDYLLVVVAAPGEALDNEFLQVFVRHVDQPGYCPDDDHVGCPVIACGAGQLLNGHSEAAAVVLQLELVGVVDDYAAVADL